MATLATRLDRFTASQDARGARPRFLAEDDAYAVPAFPNEDVFLYVKHIDNARVLREADPAARKICWRLIGSTFAFAVIVIALLLPSLNRLMAGYKMEALRQERQRLELDRAQLEFQETKLLSPARLEQLARMQRFVDPAPEAVVYLLDSGKTDAVLAKKTDVTEPRP
jgi:cell division protein FtsL